MAGESNAGTRVRTKRLEAGIKQAVLAKSVGVSPAYLNLIEHNRRRIAPELLERLSECLNVPAKALSDGADGPMVEALVAAAVDQDAGLSSDGARDLAERFPDWAQLVLDQNERVKNLESSLANLSDRMAHDPYFSDTVHEIRSAVTSIQSTSSILVEGGAMDAQLDRRFRENIYDDSLRLAQATQGLTDYMATDSSKYSDARTPQDELFAQLAELDFHIPALEDPGANPNQIAADEFGDLSPTAQKIAQSYCRQYHRTASILPLADMARPLDLYGLDIAALARALNVDFPMLFRRLASMPAHHDLPRVGLVVADASGRLIYRQPCDGFEVPRAGFGCALWPLFTALQSPQTTHSAVLSQIKRASAGAVENRTVQAFAVAERMGPPSFDRANIHRGLMLLVPTDRTKPGGVQSVGTACRVCQSATCHVRGEPSILREGF